MNCWKSINVDKHYNDWHLIFLSITTMIITFTLLYVPFSFLVDIHKLNDQHQVLFCMITLLIYPIHKSLHILVLFFMRTELGVTWKKRIHFIPFFQIIVIKPIVKWKYILALLMPFLVLNTIFIVSLFYYPYLVHFLAFLFAFHTGICMSDFIYLKSLIKSPPACFIEETDEGFEILTMSRT